MHVTQFGGRLKELREATGMTQKQLAEKAGVGLRTVSSLEQALYEPVWSTVLALAHALDVEVQAFVVHEDDQVGHTPPEPKKRGRGRPPKVPSSVTTPLDKSYSGHKKT